MCPLRRGQVWGNPLRRLCGLEVPPPQWEQGHVWDFAKGLRQAKGAMGAVVVRGRAGFIGWPVVVVRVGCGRHGRR